MLEIDGSGGGGQVLRSSLTLATLTETPVRIVDVRGNRSDPGLKRQHVAAATAIARIANAETDGIELGSDVVEFDPGEVTGGRYAVTVETAGSLTLIFETVYPLALVADAPIRLHATGGTDVAWSPPLDYLRHVKLPFVRRHGIVATVTPERRGFYPVGGGAATVTLGPSAPNRIEFEAPPTIDGARVYAVASTDLSDADVAERMARTATETLRNLDLSPEAATRVKRGSPNANPTNRDAADREDTEGDDTKDASTEAGIPVRERVVEYADADCTGAGVVVRADTSSSALPGPDTVAPIAGFSALGEPKRTAEDVAGDAVEEFSDWIDTGAVVDRHLADQLVVLIAVVGGAVWIPAVTDHVASSLDLVANFDLPVDCDQTDDRAILRAEGHDGGQ